LIIEEFISFPFRKRLCPLALAGGAKLNLLSVRVR